MIMVQIGIASKYKRGVVLSLISLCVLLWGGSLPRAQAEIAETQLEPFVRQGSIGNEKIKVVASDVMDAIAIGCDISVEHAVIEGDLNIGMATVPLQRGKPVIRGNVEIRFSEIRGDVDFSSAVFEKSAVFSSVEFTSTVSFAGATFDEYANFDSTVFSGDTEFTDALFRKNADFIAPTFNKDVSFSFAVFEGYAFFRAAAFGRNLSFADATFKGALDFADTAFTKRVSFLRASVAQPASFEAVHYYENTVPAGLWNNILRKILKFLPEKTVTDFTQFDTASVMDGSSNPYLRRYIDDEQWIRSWRESIWWRKPLFVIWELSSHCGRSIGLWAFWSALIAFGYAVIYSWFLSNSVAFSVDKLSDTKPGFRGYLYYSVVTLTTLGYGDIVPLTGTARLVVGAEVVTGYIMLGGLVSIFATKFATRS